MGRYGVVKVAVELSCGVTGVAGLGVLTVLATADP
jgi:hypothetical protein